MSKNIDPPYYGVVEGCPGLADPDCTICPKKYDCTCRVNCRGVFLNTARDFWYTRDVGVAICKSQSSAFRGIDFIARLIKFRYT